MSARHFLVEVLELLRMQLPLELKDFESVGPWGGLVKVHYGDPWAHYELWIQRRVAQIALGLHFEGDTQTNEEHLEALHARSGEIYKTLDNEVDLEPWTASWTRVHETLPLADLDEEFLMGVSTRFSEYIRVLEPMVKGNAKRQ